MIANPLARVNSRLRAAREAAFFRSRWAIPSGLREYVRGAGVAEPAGAQWLAVPLATRGGQCCRQPPDLSLRHAGLEGR